MVDSDRPDFRRASVALVIEDVVEALQPEGQIRAILPLDAAAAGETPSRLLLSADVAGAGEAFKSLVK